MNTANPEPVGRRGRGLWLWGLALCLTVGILYYQRRTGPTRPMRTALADGSVSHLLKLPRSGTTGTPAKVEIPSPAPGTKATLHWRRYPTQDDYAVVPMAEKDGMLAGELPSQPPAGKVEYYLEVDWGGTRRVPSEDDPVLRYKDPVPAVVLVPHILLMSLSILLGFRTGLAVLVRSPRSPRFAWITVVFLGVGGLILGPLVQLHAFGALWTGWPLGEDLTDNKTAVMWLAWLVAAILISRGAGVRALGRRLAVGLALFLMLAVVLIPHSARGSQLDYDRLEEGADPTDAIRTGGD